MFLLITPYDTTCPQLVGMKLFSTVHENPPFSDFPHKSMTCLPFCLPVTFNVVDSSGHTFQRYFDFFQQLDELPPPKGKLVLPVMNKVNCEMREKEEAGDMPGQCFYNTSKRQYIFVLWRE